MFSSISLILVSMLLPFGLSNQQGCPSEEDNSWNITWPPTVANQGTATQKCPGGNETEGNAIRTCINNNTWAPLDLSQCRTTKFTLFQDQVNEILVYFSATDNCNCTVESSVNTTKLFDILEIVTSGIIDTINATIPILPNDIPVIVNILETILNFTQDCKQFFVLEQRTKELRKNITTILNIMLDKRHENSFKATRVTMQKRARRASERLLRIIEKVGILFAFTFNMTDNDSQNELFNDSHIAFYVLLPSQDDVMRDGSIVFQRNMTNQNNVSMPQIRIPRRSLHRRFMRRDRRISIVNSFVSNLETRLQIDDGQSTASAIISTQLVDIASCSEDTSVDLDDDENVELRINLRTSSLINPRCAFWNFTRDGNTGGFSKKGIKTDSVDDNYILTCFSNHLTSFAVLVDTTGDNSNTPALSVVTYIGCTISIICLSFSILLILIFRVKIFNQVRHFIHINLSAALLLGLIVFVSGIETAYDSRAGCLTVAILLHYFFLAAFSWMLCEAIVLLIVVEFVFYQGFFKTAKFLTLLGWGLPVPVVAISAAVSHEQYGTNGRCWISEEKGAIWAFVAPMLLVILINSIVYIIIVHQVFKSKHNAICSEKADAIESVKASLKSAIILLPLLGVTWVFGLLAVNKDTIAFAWIFTILNSLQGLFIFFFHVVRNKKFFAMLKQHITKNASSGTHSHSLNKESTL